MSTPSTPDTPDSLPVWVRTVHPSGLIEYLFEIGDEHSVAVEITPPEEGEAGCTLSIELIDPYGEHMIDTFPDLTVAQVEANIVSYQEEALRRALIDSIDTIQMLQEGDDDED